MHIQHRIFTQTDVERIHNASMSILENVGITFHDAEAIKLLAPCATRIEGKTIFLQERAVRDALESAPSQFTMAARNTEHNVVIGGDLFVCAPGYGAPFIVTLSGEKRAATLADYMSFCKLVHTSTSFDMNGFLLVEPSDIPADTAYLHMLFSNITLSDKVFMGSPLLRESAHDTLDMAGILWGGKSRILNYPVLLASINVLSPLQYSKEMTGALIEFSQYGRRVWFRQA